MMGKEPRIDEKLRGRERKQRGKPRQILEKESAPVTNGKK